MYQILVSMPSWQPLRDWESTVASVQKTELLIMHQDHGQHMQSFAGKVKGKAQVFPFA